MPIWPLPPTFASELVYVEQPEDDIEPAKGDACVVIESVKAAGEVKAPVSGTVVETNELLVDEPGKVNEDPEGDAWFFKIKASDPSQMDDMMDEAAYKAFIG